MERQSVAGLLRNFDDCLGWNVSRTCWIIGRAMLGE